MRRLWPFLVVVVVLVLFFGGGYIYSNFYNPTPTTTTVAPSVAAITTPSPAVTPPVAAALAGDLCSDIPGLQTAADIVANRLIRNSDGTCTVTSTASATLAPPLDLCSNIDGPQTVVPSGMIRQGTECVIEPTATPAPTAKLVLPSLSFLDLGALPAWVIQLGVLAVFFTVVILLLLLVIAFIRFLFRTAVAAPGPAVIAAPAVARVRLTSGRQSAVLILAAILAILLLEQFDFFHLSSVPVEPLILWLLIAVVAVLLIAVLWGTVPALGLGLVAFILALILLPDLAPTLGRYVEEARLGRTYTFEECWVNPRPCVGKALSVVLDDKTRGLSPGNGTEYQVRVAPEAGCVKLFSRSNELGRLCPGEDKLINGVIYAGKSADDTKTRAYVTWCPFGSRGFNIGSCT